VIRSNQAADAAPDVFRVSLDAQATVKSGPLARGGKSRVQVAAAEHDFAPEAMVTPVGIFLPTWDELFVYGVTSKVTSDGLVDRLVQWWESVRERFAHITTLGLNLDNGPENHSRRTQFMQRMVTFVRQYHLHVRLVYDPPYHSKYNPVERCWGILENHWNGALLDSLEALLGLARTMTWQGLHPVVALVTTTYQTGVTLTKGAMDGVEAQIERLSRLPSTGCLGHVIIFGSLRYAHALVPMTTAASVPPCHACRTHAERSR
jgi:transposase